MGGQESVKYYLNGSAFHFRCTVKLKRESYIQAPILLVMYSLAIAYTIVVIVYTTFSSLRHNFSIFSYLGHYIVHPFYFLCFYKKYLRARIIKRMKSKFGTWFPSRFEVVKSLMNLKP